MATYLSKGVDSLQLQFRQGFFVLTQLLVDQNQPFLQPRQKMVLDLMSIKLAAIAPESKELERLHANSRKCTWIQMDYDGLIESALALLFVNQLQPFLQTLNQIQSAIFAIKLIEFVPETKELAISYLHCSYSEFTPLRREFTVAAIQIGNC